MNNVRNVIFIAIGALLLFTVLGNMAIYAVSPDDERPERSYLEGRNYQQFPELTSDNIASGTSQSQFEQYFADLIPHRDAVLLANAASQRASIALASIPAGYDAYHTFYGSSYVYCPKWNAVVERPLKTDSVDSALDYAAQTLGKFMDEHSQINWKMALVDRCNTSSASPVHDLVADPIDQDYLNEKLMGKLSDRCERIDVSYDDTEEFFTDFFTTDHHWQIQGAVKAYERISESLGLDALQLEYVTGFKGPFYGSEARGGLLTDEYDSISDVSYRHSEELTVEADGVKQDTSYLDFSWKSDSQPYIKSRKYSNVYAGYFHGDPALLTIRNGEVNNGKSLLIIGDSFTNNVERLFAESYEAVYVIDPRSYSRSIGDFLEDNPVDDAVFIWSINTATTTSVIEKFA